MTEPKHDERSEDAGTVDIGWPPALGWVPAERCFRLLAPRAEYVELVERAHPERGPQRVTAMRRQACSWLEPGWCDPSVGAIAPAHTRHTRDVWHAEIAAPLGYYRFRVHRPWGSVTVADPWARAVARRKRVGHSSWAVAVDPLPALARGGQGGVRLDPSSAVILEVHLGDATSHPSAGAVAPGTYAGFAELHPAAVGGARHALSLGVDAVELLPVTSWPVLESAERRNYWGYMPSFFCAVSERYAKAWAGAAEGDWVGVGADGDFADPALELRAMIDTLHAQGLGVIVDLVYNHVSAHDDNPLLLLDPGDWFHRDIDPVDGRPRLRSHSGCGNDLRTAAPEMRALVVASVRRWFGELGVDGVRLDLAELLDDQTLVTIRDAARAIRPDALLIAEPWSLRGYRPGRLAELGWVVWDDRYRNGLKGSSPAEVGLLRPAQGGERGGQTLATLLSGDSVDVGGALPRAELGLSYLVAHDGYTLGDFWRLALGEAEPGALVDVDAAARPSLALRRALMLSNAALLLTRGPVMLHLGQTWGRAKVRRPDVSAGAGGAGVLDHNSYDRDDDTNHIDWSHRSKNPEITASAAAWTRARRRWLRPVFGAGGGPEVVVDPWTGAVALLWRGAEGPVVCGVNPSSAVAHLPLPSAAWAVQVASPAPAQLSYAGGGTQLTLPPQGAALLTAWT